MNNDEQQLVLEETAREAADVAQIAAEAAQRAGDAAHRAGDAAHRAGDAAERIRQMVKKIKEERAKGAQKIHGTRLHLPEIQLQSVATLGGCQVLAVTATEHQPALEYVLAAQAMADKNLVIKEIGGGGSVPRLMVKNKLDLPVLILEGDLLIGGKQNRLSNSSVLIPQKTKMPLPVSCIEHGRWGRSSRRRSPRGPNVPAPDAFAMSMDCLAAPVTRELRHAKLSDGESIQAKVWDSIAHLESACDYHSNTSDHEELLRVSREELEDFLESTHCPDDAIGVAVVAGDQSYSLDLFDRSETCRHYWQMKIHSSLMQRRRLHTRDEPISTAALEEDLEQLYDERWITRRRRDAAEQQLGAELYARTEKRSTAAALAYESLPVHVSLLSES